MGSAGGTWGVCHGDSKGEHSQGDVVSLAAFLSQVQGKRETIVFNQIEVYPFPRAESGSPETQLGVEGRGGYRKLSRPLATDTGRVPSLSC